MAGYGPREATVSEQAAYVPPIGSLLPDFTLGAVVLIDPSDCVVCNTSLTKWVLLRRERPDLVRLVLARTPSTDELRELALYRFKPDGVINGYERPRGEWCMPGLLGNSGCPATRLVCGAAFLNATVAAEMIQTSRGASVGSHNQQAKECRACARHV